MTQTATAPRPVPLAIAVTLLALILAASAAEPSGWRFSDRVERHMLPSVSTGPEAPAWSADGRIAFSRQGDIWIVPATGGQAVALTHGPNYYFEPAWSPDNRQIACSTIDPDWHLGIAVIDVATGAVQPIPTGAGVSVEPAWSHDGRSLYYVNMVSGRGGHGATIFRHDLGGGAPDSQVGSGYQPAISPDGTQMAYVAPVRGELGTGGLWVRPVVGGEPRLVRYEETEYRMKPAWTPDGKSFLYVSDEEGFNDIRILALQGGEPVGLTPDRGDQYAPTPSPDGKRFAFVSNRAGATALYTVAIGGGPFPSWTRVPIASWKNSTPTGHVHLRVLDAGHAVPADVFLVAADGRSYTPDGGFAREIVMSHRHYFETTGTSDIEVPAGRVAIEAMKGYEYKPASISVDVPAGGAATATLALTRLVNLPARGWYSGDPHIHDLHQGMFGLTHEVFFNELVAADVHVTSALIHMDGTRLMGRWSDLTGKPSPLSTPSYILQYAEEFRGSLGHMELLGIQRFLLPFTAGNPGTPYAQPTLDDSYIDGVHAQGGIAGFPHPYVNPPNTPTQAAATLIAVDAALGKGDFYDVGSLSSDELGSAEFYDRLLDCGFHIAASAGTDNFSNVERDPPPGSDRVYVHVKGPLTYQSWMAGVKAGHTFGSTGPLLTLDVAGREPGDEIQLAERAPTTLHVHADAISIAPMSEMDVLVNGQVAQAIKAGDPLHLVFDGEVSLPQGGWVGLRAVGPTSKYVADTYAFAQTTPVYVLRGGHQWVSAADAAFLAQTVDAIWNRVANSPWRSDADRDQFQATLNQAKAVYEKLAAQATPQTPAATDYDRRR